MAGIPDVCFSVSISPLSVTLNDPTCAPVLPQVQHVWRGPGFQGICHRGVTYLRGGFRLSGGR